MKPKISAKFKWEAYQNMNILTQYKIILKRKLLEHNNF